MVKEIIEEAWNGSFHKIVIVAVAGILSAGVVALWGMNGHMSALDERINLWATSFQQQILELSKKDSEIMQGIGTVRDRLLEDEKHVFRNDERIDNILQRLNRLENLSGNSNR